MHHLQGEFHATVDGGPPTTISALDKPAFSPLEWSVIRLARADRLSTLHAPGRFSRFANWLMGRKGSPELANERLEALRRLAVLSWHFGSKVPHDEVTDFIAKGFSPTQYMLMLGSIRAAARVPQGMAA